MVDYSITVQGQASAQARAYKEFLKRLGFDTHLDVMSRSQIGVSCGYVGARVLVVTDFVAGTGRG